MSASCMMPASETATFESVLFDSGGTDIELTWACENIDLIIMLARGLLGIKPIDRVVTTTPIPQKSCDSVVCIEVGNKPVYPKWCDRIVCPEPVDVKWPKYDVALIERWRHTGQRVGSSIGGDKVYARIKKMNGLQRCLGLRDLIEIEKKGSGFFQKHFANTILVGWASVISSLDDDADLYVPCLRQPGQGNVLFWSYLQRPFTYEYCAPMHGA